MAGIAVLMMVMLMTFCIQGVPLGEEHCFSAAEQFFPAASTHALTS